MHPLTSLSSLSPKYTHIHTVHPQTASNPPNPSQAPLTLDQIQEHPVQYSFQLDQPHELKFTSTHNESIVDHREFYKFLEALK